jgi:peptidyl-prolyl cis-trans isomerase C
MKRAVLVLIASILVLGACSSEKKLASVDGKSISVAEFESYLAFKRLTPKDAEHRSKLLQAYLEREALTAEIEKQDVLDKALTAAEINEFRKEMLISRYFEKYLAKQVADDAVLNFYNSNAADFENTKSRVAHILFRVNQNMGENERKAKLTAAQETYSKINAGQAFEDLAQAVSEDKVSGKKGGDLGWLVEGAIERGFSEKVFAMQAGEISEPFETAFGFHIVKVLEAPVVVKQPFDSVKGKIRHQLRTKSKDAELKRLVELADIQK